MRKKVGKWTMLVDQLFTIRDVAPSGCQPAYLITEVLFLAMLQVSDLFPVRGSSVDGALCFARSSNFHHAMV